MPRPRFHTGALETGQRFHLAREAVQSILARSVPTQKTLIGLYGSERHAEIARLIEAILPSSLKGVGRPRRHDYEAPSEIYDTRTKISKHKDYQAIQSLLLQWQLPEVKQFEKFYGEYAESVRAVFEKFLALRLKRKCGISSTAHLHRVGAVVWALGMDNDTSRRYSAVGALHDAIEDLLYRLKDARGEPFDLHSYDDFVSALVPADLLSAVMLLSNHYDLILGAIRFESQRNQIYFSKEYLLERLSTLEAEATNSLKPYLRKMITVFPNIDLGDRVYENAKWECYERLYIPQVALTARSADNWRLLQLKAIDLADNFHGREALATDRQIRNITKMTIWAKAGYAMKSTWSPLNAHIMELQQDSLEGAEGLILRDLLQTQSCLDFVVSALLKVKELSPVFFVR
jgi:hypothetical protein